MVIFNITKASCDNFHIQRPLLTFKLFPFILTHVTFSHLFFFTFRCDSDKSRRFFLFLCQSRKKAREAFVCVCVFVIYQRDTPWMKCLEHMIRKDPIVFLSHFDFEFQFMSLLVLRDSTKGCICAWNHWKSLNCVIVLKIIVLRVVKRKGL